MRWSVALALLLGVLAGCATPRQQTGAAPTTRHSDPRSVPIFEGDSGDPTAWPDLVGACRGADVVVIGENHGHPVGLPFAAALWRDVLKDAPKAALALEFFERDEQSHLDEYLLGVVDEPTFRKRAQRSASNYPEGHRDMVEAARDAKRPVIAANAPRPLVRLARLEGYDRLRGLTPELQRLARIPESLPEGRYRDDFIKLMTGGGHDGQEGKTVGPEATARAEAMFLSQSLWDWTMADSVLRSVGEGNTPTVLVVGRFHVDHQGGLVYALQHLRPDARVVVVTTVDESSDQLLEADRGRGTFVVYVGPSGPE